MPSPWQDGRLFRQTRSRPNEDKLSLLDGSPLMLRAMWRRSYQNKQVGYAVKQTAIRHPQAHWSDFGEHGSWNIDVGPYTIDGINGERCDGRQRKMMARLLFTGAYRTRAGLPKHWAEIEELCECGGRDDMWHILARCPMGEEIVNGLPEKVRPP